MDTKVQYQFDSTKATAIERIDRPTPEEFKKNFFSCKKPVIITGKMENWKALSSWTPDYLNSVLGDKEVDVNVSQNQVFIGDLKNGFALLRNKMKFADFINLLLEPNKPTDKYYYLQQQPIPIVFPDLLEDIQIPEYFDPKLSLPPHLWVGGSDNISPLHYDATNNLLAQVRGRKRLLLFEPKQTTSLYPFPAHSKLAHLSQINIDQPDLNKFPKFQETKYLECILEPGEILFIPPFWWHQVYSLEQLNISVNFWWKIHFKEFFTYPGRRLAAQLPNMLWYTLKNMVSSNPNS